MTIEQWLRDPEQLSDEQVKEQLRIMQRVWEKIPIGSRGKFMVPRWATLLNECQFRGIRLRSLTMIPR